VDQCSDNHTHSDQGHGDGGEETLKCFQIRMAVEERSADGGRNPSVCGNGCSDESDAQQGKQQFGGHEVSIGSIMNSLKAG
jgi:hypothetical protein